MSYRESRLHGLLIDAVEEYGHDFVDPYAANKNECQYTYYNEDGEAKHCIAGQVLVNAGINVADLEKAVDVVGNSSVRQVNNHLRNVGNDTGLNDAEISQLSLCQMLQDRGFSWGAVFNIYQATKSVVGTIDDACAVVMGMSIARTEGQDRASRESND